MRRAAKVDGNQQGIVEALRAIGCSVDVSPATDGRPDLLVGVAGHNVLLEVKDGDLPPSARLLTPAQKKWHAGWKGTAHVVNNVAEALLVIGRYRGRQ